MTWSDEILYDRVRRGDGAAFAALAARYWMAVHRIAWNMLDDLALAAEVGEATFRAALRADQAFPAGVPFRTSLYRVAMGESWLRLKRTAGRGGVENVRRALQRLAPLDRAAFLLKDVEEVSAEESAAILGVPPGTVRARSHRAILSLTTLVSGPNHVEQLRA